MKSTTLWVGLDVHKESISVAVFEDARSQGRPVVAIPNEPTSIRKVFSRLKKEGEVRVGREQSSAKLTRPIERMLLAQTHNAVDDRVAGLVRAMPGYRLLVLEPGGS